MAKSAEMSAKDIAALFRSAVEAEDMALLGDTSTFAEQQTHEDDPESRDLPAKSKFLAVNLSMPSAMAAYVFLARPLVRLLVKE
jgi:hypothetical protein